MGFFPIGIMRVLRGGVKNEVNLDRTLIFHTIKNGAKKRSTRSVKNPV